MEQRVATMAALAAALAAATATAATAAPAVTAVTAATAAATAAATTAAMPAVDVVKSMWLQKRRACPIRRSSHLAPRDPVAGSDRRGFLISALSPFDRG